MAGTSHRPKQDGSIDLDFFHIWTRRDSPQGISVSGFPKVSRSTDIDETDLSDLFTATVGRRMTLRQPAQDIHHRLSDEAYRGVSILRVGPIAKRAIPDRGVRAGQAVPQVPGMVVRSASNSQRSGLRAVNTANVG
jgi:hypothetical protein